jgi:hypothetical protein
MFDILNYLSYLFFKAFGLAIPVNPPSIGVAAVLPFVSKIIF